MANVIRRDGHEESFDELQIDEIIEMGNTGITFEINDGMINAIIEEY